MDEKLMEQIIDQQNKIYQLQGMLESAHSFLDTLGVPRKLPQYADVTLTLRGRLDWIVEHCPGEYRQLDDAIMGYWTKQNKD